MSGILSKLTLLSLYSNKKTASTNRQFCLSMNAVFRSSPYKRVCGKRRPGCGREAGGGLAAVAVAVALLKVVGTFFHLVEAVANEVCVLTDGCEFVVRCGSDTIPHSYDFFLLRIERSPEHDADIARQVALQIAHFGALAISHLLASSLHRILLHLSSRRNCRISNSILIL